MWDGLEAQVSINSLIWLFPVFFMIHDFEEIIFIEGWLDRHGDAVQSKIPKWMKPAFLRISGMNAGQFAVAVMLEFIFLAGCTYAAAERGWYPLFVGCNAVMLFHVFTHLGQSLYLRRYTPGVVTAVLVSLPYPLYLFHRMIQDGLISAEDIYRDLAYGAILLPLVLAGHELGRRVVPGKNKWLEE